MNKICILSRIEEEKAQFEKAFSYLMDQGGEIIFVTNPDDLLKMVETEKPTLLIIDSIDYDRGDLSWEEKTTHLLVVREKGEKRGKESISIFRPIDPDEVLRLTQSWISKGSEQTMLPM